eukprot:3426803-Amphidinium_carterae.1
MSAASADLPSTCCRTMWPQQPTPGRKRWLNNKACAHTIVDQIGLTGGARHIILNEFGNNNRR